MAKTVALAILLLLAAAAAQARLLDPPVAAAIADKLCVQSVGWLAALPCPAADSYPTV